jgi:hypothetical protein
VAPHPAAALAIITSTRNGSGDFNIHHPSVAYACGLSRRSARDSTCGRPMFLSAASDFKTTLGSLGAIATLSYGHSKHFRYQALDCQTHAGVFPGQRCQRTSEATDDVSTVSLDLSRGAQLFIHHLAGHRDS